MRTFLSILATAFFCIGRVVAAPALASILRRDAIQAILDPPTVINLTAAEIAAFIPYEQFAGAAYCPSSNVIDWECGTACEALPGFEPTLTGGDGDAIQLYYVGYWPTENAVVVAHEGTNPAALLADLTDADYIMEPLNTTLFPSVPSDVLVHSGFANEQALTAEIVLAETRTLIAERGATTVILVGHSLGAAIAELDSLFMSMNLPAYINIMGRTFGTPRVGNPAYANLFDLYVPDFTRLDNQKDPIPTVPEQIMGFEHPMTEVHVVSEADNYVVACPGNDNDVDPQCTDLSVPSILVSNIADHVGPYPGGVYIGVCLLEL